VTLGLLALLLLWYWFIRVWQIMAIPIPAILTFGLSIGTGFTGRSEPPRPILAPYCPFYSSIVRTMAIAVLIEPDDRHHRMDFDGSSSGIFKFVKDSYA
jgi:hypothetical protein